MPVNYLILIEAVDVLPRLFSTVLIPPGVRDELSHSKAPAAVRSWISQPPDWLTAAIPKPLTAPEHSTLHQGERQAIQLAVQERCALLIDDRTGAFQARSQGVESIGTLAVLFRTSQHGWVDLPEMFRRLRATSFRSPIRLMARILEEDALGKP